MMLQGLALWQFCDIKVDQSNTSTGRPGGINNKGLLSQWRKPKLAAPTVAAAYATAPRTHQDQYQVYDSLSLHGS